MVGGLFWSERGRNVADQGLVYRADLHLVAGRPDLDRARFLAKDDFNTPNGGGRVVVAPGKLGWNEVRRVDGSIDGDIDRDGFRVAWEGCIHRDGSEIRRDRIGTRGIGVGCHFHDQTCTGGQQDCGGPNQYALHAISHSILEDGRGWVL